MSDRQYIYKNYIHERNELIKKVNKEYRKLFPKKNKVLGILCRGTDYIYAKPKDHAIPIDVFEMIEIAKQYVAKYKYEYIYLCTEDEYILNKFQDVFKSRLLFTSQNRYTDTGDSRLAVIMRENTSKKRVNEEYLRGEEYYVTIALLAKCDRLLATHCGGTTGVVTINGSKYKECRILGKGFWNQNGKYPLVVESRNKNLIKLQLDKLPNCQDGIKIIKLINGRLKLDGTAERDTSIKLCEYTQIYLKPFVDFRISIYGFKEFDVNDAHLTLKLYDSRYLEDKSTGITFCCLDNKSYNFDVPIIAYEVYTVIKQNVKINEEVYVQFEQSSEISNYVEGICSETEIALKDDKNNYYELINKDYIDLNNFIMYINGNAIKLANSEIIKLKNVIKYEGGILNYRYKNNFIGYEEKCVRFTYNDRLL